MNKGSSLRSKSQGKEIGGKAGEEKGGWLWRESASETDVYSGTYCRANNVNSGLATGPPSLPDSERDAFSDN